jgi:co-chaperonin GroES (HSP10)
MENKQTLIPLNRRVLVELINDVEKTESGLIITTEEVPLYLRGKVNCISPTSEYKGLIEVDDIVIFRRDKGVRITLNNVEYISLQDNELETIII